MPKIPETKKEELEVRISRLNSLIENCRLDLAQPFSIGVVRYLEKTYGANEISKEDYELLSRDIDKSINKSNKCICEHPMATFA